MNEAIDWVKKHPVYVVGGLGLFFVLYWVFSSGSGSGQASGSTGPDDAVQIANLQSQTQLQSEQLSLQGQSNQIGGQIQLAQISAQVANYQTEQAANVQELGITSQTQVQLAGLATQGLIAQIQANTQQTQINAVKDIALAPYQLQESLIQGLTQPLNNDQHTSLGSLLGGAEGTKNAYFSGFGLSAGRNTPAGSGVGNIGGDLSGFAALIGVL